MMLTPSSNLSEDVKNTHTQISHIIQNLFHDMYIISNSQIFFARPIMLFQSFCPVAACVFLPQ